jgi:hypothetical protein
MTATALALTRGRVAHLAQSAEVSLGLLRAIDGTIDALGYMEKVLEGLTGLTFDAIKDVRSIDATEGVFLDPDDTVIDILERVETESKNMLALFVSKRVAIDKDSRLQEHHYEALHDGYGRVIDLLAELAGGVTDLRQAIIGHDLNAEPRGSAEVFKTVDALLASLKQ